MYDAIIYLKAVIIDQF